MYRMLIVDDEKMIREGICNSIDWVELGIEKALTAASGNEAIRICREQKIDVVLTDISMEGMNGLELVSRLRETDQDMRIIMMTAYDRFEYAQESCRLQVSDFLLKPINEEEVTEVIRKQLKCLEEQSRKNRLQPVEKMMERTLLEQAFQKVLHGKAETAELIPHLKKAGFDLEKPFETVFLHMIEDEHTAEWENDRDFLWMSLRQAVMEIIENGNAGIIFRSRQDITEILLYCMEKVDEPRQVLETIQNVIYSEYNVRVKIICGSRAENISQFMESYQEALRLTKESIGSYKTVLQPEINVLRDELFRSTLAELKKEMLLNLGNYQRMMHVFNVFVTDTVTYQLSASEVRMHCFEIASSLFYAYVMETGETADNRLCGLLSSMSLADSEEACEYTRKFITGMFGREEETSHEIINKAKTYINRHIAEDISVSVLAEESYMSPSYFSRLFKKVVGMGCNEYIVHKRMKIAQDLLMTTPLPTGEIAVKVGYNDKNYFSLAFKRNTGMSPTEYREKRSVVK